MQGLVVESLKIQAEFLRGSKEIVSPLSFCIESGQTLAVVGESGSGKTMSALALLGILPNNCFASGSAMLDGEQLISSRNAAKKRGKEIVFIAQSGAEFLNPSLKIKSQIFESLKINGVKNRRERESIAEKNLELVGFENSGQVLEKYPFELSGGQAQRVTLAIALCSRPKLIIADEATKGVDRETADELRNMLEKYFADACRMYITHNMEFAAECDKLLVLKDGVVREYGKTADILQNPKSEYTRLLLAAVPGKRSGICC